MNHEPVSFITGDALPELLKRPIGSRVTGHIEVKKPARADLHNEEDIDQFECRRDDNEEVASVVSLN
jgi:hypothetical protein